MRKITTAAMAFAMLTAIAGFAKADETWNHGGFYAGVVGGYNTTALKAEGIDFAGSGAFGGAVLGIGVVSGGTYYGLEVDGMLRDIKPSVTDTGGTVTFSNAWMATGRVRVGLPIGPALLYATGGAAVTESKLAATGFGSDQAYVLGAVGGGGIELITLANMAVRVEALHYAMPAETFSLSGVEASVKQSETVARVGIVFKLQ